MHPLIKELNGFAQLPSISNNSLGLSLKNGHNLSRFSIIRNYPDHFQSRVMQEKWVELSSDRIVEEAGGWGAKRKEKV